MGRPFPTIDDYPIQKHCLSQTFGVSAQTIEKIAIEPGHSIENVFFDADSTRPNKILLTAPRTLDRFFAPSWSGENERHVLHEYAHVIRQWNTKRMGVFSYSADPSFWENEAENEARRKERAYRTCLVAQAVTIALSILP